MNTTGSNASGTSVAQAENLSALNPGESYIASATVKIPNGYNGAYQVVVTADIAEHINDENRTNNKLSRAITLNIPPLPDLTIANVQAPAQAFAGGQVSINWTVENSGDAPTQIEPGRLWRDRVYLSTDETLNTSQDRLIFTSASRLSPLAVNGTYTSHTRQLINNEMTDISLPHNLAAGTYYVFAVADIGDAVYEFIDENNNTGYDHDGIGFPMTVLVAPPDLVIDNAPMAPETASSGQNIDVAFTVRNQGAFSAIGSRRDAIFLSTDNVLDEDDTRSASVTRSTLAAGATADAEFSLILPDCISGTFYLIGAADVDKQITEFDIKTSAEENNASPAKQIEISLTPPDLQVTYISTSPITLPGQQVNVSWTISNTGTGATRRPWNDRIMLISDSGFQSVQLAQFTQESVLAAGASVSRSLDVFLPAFMDGQYRIAVITDHSRLVPECGPSEANNEASTPPFNVDNNLPDLVIDSVSTPATPVIAGEQFPVEWTGRNMGGDIPAATQGWRDHVYLSSDQNLSNGDRLLTSNVVQQGLTTGQTYNRQINISTQSAGRTLFTFIADGAAIL